MLLTTLLTVVLVVLLLACTLQPSHAPLVLAVWPDQTPQVSGIGESGPIVHERVRDPSD